MVRETLSVEDRGSLSFPTSPVCPLASGMGIADPSQPRTVRSPKAHIFPVIIDLLYINGGVVVLKGGALITDVAAKEGHVAAALDVRLDIRKHVCAPVFVMPYTEQQLITCEEVPRVFVDVEIRAVVHWVAVLLEPTDKRDVPMCEGLARRGRVIDIRGNYCGVWQDVSRAAARAAQG